MYSFALGSTGPQGNAIDFIATIVSRGPEQRSYTYTQCAPGVACFVSKLYISHSYYRNLLEGKKKMGGRCILIIFENS